MPDGELDEVFRRAVQANDGDFMLTSGGVIRAWQDRKAEKLRTGGAPTPIAGYLPAVECHRCKGMGWLVDRSDPHPSGNWRPLIPCPECRR